MKIISLSILAIFLSCLGFSQMIIENPTQGMSTASGVNLYKIEINDTSTVLCFHTTAQPGNWISIPEKTFIQPVNGQKLYILASEGIPLGKRYTMPETGKVDYKLIFPKIDKAVSIIDYGEGNEGGSWFIYDICLKPEPGESNVPKGLKGNWFNTVTGDWELSLFDAVAVYKSRIWKYGNSMNEKGYIILKNNNSEIRLFTKIQKDGFCQFGETLKDLKTYTSDVNNVKPINSLNDKPFEVPVFKTDTAIFSGFINGYTPRAGIKTGRVAVNNILTGEQNTYLIKIKEDGSFSVKIPMYYPEIGYIQSEAYNGSVFLVPGKEVFMMLTLGNKKYKLLFMGEYGRLNKDLDLLEKINSLNYRKLQDTVLDMTPTSYKSYILALKQKDMDKLESYKNDNVICAKAYQVKKLGLEYRYAMTLMEYDMLYQSAYMKKNKIAPNQRMTPVRHDTITAEYYDFLTNESVNNPLAVINSDYFFFINRLKYMELVRPNRKSISFRPIELAEAVVKEGYSLTPEEKNWIEAEKQKESSGLNNEYKKFMEENGEKLNVLRAKFKNNIQELYKTRKDSFSLLMLEKYLIDKGVNISEDEKALFSALRDFEKTEYSVREREFQKKYTETMKGFYSKYNNFMNSYFKRQSMETRKEVLEKQLGIKPGLATDIMNSQDELRPIVQEMTPVSDSALTLIRKEFVTPFVAQYAALCNEYIKSRLADNKKIRIGYVVNETPKTDGDKLFDEMMKKYRGKVVYVDFWATWCGPCRSGMERIKPLKEEMKGENIVFVYITNQTSPKGTWENMMAEIGGEHFRVSSDEWNYLTDKFNITGIPHYVLVGKDGSVINSHLSFMSNDMLKQELLKHINK